MTGSHRKGTMCWFMTIAFLTTLHAQMWLNLGLKGCHFILTNRWAGLPREDDRCTPPEEEVPS